jgi:predicted  nucleic acid-binding Zn-ribbon protein
MSKDRKKLLSLAEYEKLIAERWDTAKKGRPTGVACGGCGGELVRALHAQVQTVNLIPRVLVQCGNRECGAMAYLLLPPGAQ